jgi:proteasome accessory factor C
MLAIIPWIAERDGPRIAEVCRRFGVSRARLLADLDVVFLVGLYPFTPDELIDVVIEDNRVWIHLTPGAFARPLRLTPEQGLDLAGPLARGLGKLADLLGIDESEAIAITLGTAQREVLDVLRAGLDDRHPVRISYYAFGRDEWTERTVEPWQLFTDAGQWYLAGWCRLAQDRRLFRVDRIRDADASEGSYEVPGDIGELAVYRPLESDPRVVLELARDVDWVLEQYVHEEVEALDDGRIRVRLPVSAPAWLERLLLRLGPSAKLIAADPPLAPTLGRDAAARILRRYREQPVHDGDPPATAS